MEGAQALGEHLGANQVLGRSDQCDICLFVATLRPCIPGRAARVS